MVANSNLMRGGPRGGILSGEGQPRANESGPPTILQPLKQGRRRDTSMPKTPATEKPAPSSDHTPLEDPIPIGSVFGELMARLLEREANNNDSLGKD